MCTHERPARRRRTRNRTRRAASSREPVTEPVMSRRFRLVAAVLAPVVLALAGCAGVAATASPTPGIVELRLRTVEAGACMDALMPDVRLAADSAVPGSIVAVSRDGARTPLVFPAGTRAAVHVDRNVIELVMPEGERVLVGPEDRISFGGGQLGGQGDAAWFACSLVPSEG